MSQTTYSIDHAAAQAGQLVDIGPKKHVSRAAQVAIPFGRFCALGTDKDKQVKLPTSAAEVRAGLGFSFAETSREYLAGGFEIGAAVPVLRMGAQWVQTEGSVVAGGQVYVRHTSDGGSNTQLGTVRGDADAGRAEPYLGARFLTSVTGAGLAAVDVWPQTPQSLVVEDITTTAGLDVTTDLDVGGDADITGDLDVGGDILTGNLGPLTTGHQFAIGPFAEAAAATQTANVVNLGGAAVAYRAIKNGSVMGLSVTLSEAITGTDATLDVFVTKNGTKIAASEVSFTTAGAETFGVIDLSASPEAYDAEDAIGVVYDSHSALSNTPTIVATVIVAE